jgi:hypothetical protein
MSATLLSSVGETVSLIFQALLAALVLCLLALIVSATVRSRRALQFEPWTDFTSPEDPKNASTLGRRAAELLLAEIRDIQSVHQRSKRGLDLDNPYYDIPAFQQDLDDDLKLLASVTPQSQGPVVGEIVSVVLALLPVKPARLKGSIHRTHGTTTLVASIESLRSQKSKTRQFRVSGKLGPDDDPGALIRTLAYAVYLELSTSSAFSRPDAFRSYTEGVKQHLALAEDETNPALQQRAVRCYEAARRKEPTNPAVLYNLGVLNYYRYEPQPNQEAIGLFRSALWSAEGQLKAQVHSGLCNALLQGYHRFDGGPAYVQEALLQAKRALAIDPHLDVALKALAFAYHQQSEELVKPSCKTEQAEPEPPAAKTDIGVARALEALNYAQARWDAESADNSNAEKEPPAGAPSKRSVTGGPPRESARARTNRIRRYRSRAIHLYRRTTRVNPKYYVAYNNLGNLYLEWAQHCPPRKQRHLLHLAERMALKSIAIKPSYWHAYDNVGNACRSLGRLGDEGRFAVAKRYYDEACALRPAYMAARADLALLHLCPGWRDRRYREAVLLQRSALRNAATVGARKKYASDFLKAVEELRLDETDSVDVTLGQALIEWEDDVHGRTLPNASQEAMGVL